MNQGQGCGCEGGMGEGKGDGEGGNNGDGGGWRDVPRKRTKIQFPLAEKTDTKREHQQKQNLDNKKPRTFTQVSLEEFVKGADDRAEKREQERKEKKRMEDERRRGRGERGRRGRGRRGRKCGFT